MRPTLHALICRTMYRLWNLKKKNILDFSYTDVQPLTWIILTKTRVSKNF